jgi:hypothetical protein
MGDSNGIYRRIPPPPVEEMPTPAPACPALHPRRSGPGPARGEVFVLHSSAFPQAFERLHPEEGVLSPILVRPVREQLEHDRVIRLLQPRYKRRFAVGINPGPEQTAPVGTGADVQFPDLVLTSQGAGKKLAGVIEVETSESVNQLEAMAQWARFGRLPVEFFLYVPSGVAGVARRLCSEHGIGVTEIWTYHAVGDQVRFAQVHRAALAEKLSAARAAAAEARRAGARASEAVKARPKRTSAKPAAKRPAAKTARPAAKRALRKKR